MYLFIYIRIHTDMQQDVCSYNRYIRYTYYVYVYVCEGQCIHTLRYVTLRYVTLHYMHSSMHTYISMYTLIHLYTCMYRGLLQAVHRERTVKKTHAWHKIYRNYLFSCDIKKPHSQKRKPTKQDPILWALSEANGHTTRNM